MWDHDKSSWPNHEFSRFVEAAGIRWHIQQMGSGAVLLLVHGTGASTHSWRDLMPLLARRYSVLAVDLPGHGFTDPVPGARSSIPGMANALAQLLRVMRLDPAFGVGHSAGAVVICRMALDGHIAPRAIAGINGAFLPLRGAAGLMFSPIARLLAMSTLLPRFIAPRMNSRDVARLIAGTGSGLDEAGVDLYARLVRNPDHLAGALRMMGHWNLHEFERDLPRLRAALALIVADNDLTVAPSQALEVQRRVAHATVHRLAGLGHLAHEENPGRVADVLLAICAGFDVI